MIFKPHRIAFVAVITPFYASSWGTWPNCGLEIQCAYRGAKAWSLQAVQEALYNCPKGGAAECPRNSGLQTSKTGKLKNACSGPTLEKGLFQFACTQHDYCYMTLNKGKNYCDNTFDHNMKTICKAMPSSPFGNPVVEACYRAATLNRIGLETVWAFDSYNHDQDLCRPRRKRNEMFNSSDSILTEEKKNEALKSLALLREEYISAGILNSEREEELKNYAVFLNQN
ncbi:hypothetical protein HDU92_008077 [Lobulomyces angularis]|nr:hypothetical protein HDU92_008077 [Lobulomyces angularis]